jgi:putative hydrolase
VMSLLEGHGNFVMDAVARNRIPGVATFKRKLHERRHRAGVEKAFQKAIGFDTKVRQYEVGERFVAEVVDRIGMGGFNRVWERAANLPTIEEVHQPEAWVARVAAAS